jgi:hypothetical protein
VKLSSLGRTRPQSKSLSARGLIQLAQSPTTGIFVWHWWPNRSERLSEAPWKGGCSLLSRFDPVYIPHDIENRRVATGIDEGRNSRLAALLPHLRRSRKRARPTSQGGDTGSNPVGTTNDKAQVKGPALPVNRMKAIPLAVPDPANIPHEIDFSAPRSPSRRLSLADDSAPLREPGRWLGGGHHHGTAVWVRVR